MDESKGKGKSPATSNGNIEGAPADKSTEPSILSRVAASASGLTRNAFAGPAGGDAASTILSSTEKGSSSTGSAGENYWSQNISLSTSSRQPESNSSSSLRVGHSEAHAKQAENDFAQFLDGIDSFVPSEDTNITQNMEVSNSFDQAWDRSQSLYEAPTSETAARAVAEQQSRDGEDVLQLLSDTRQEDFEAPEEMEETVDWGLSDEQIMKLRAITKEAFPLGKSPAVANGDPSLHLIPVLEEFNMDDWFEQWDGVLNRYADEVWGGLLPLVKDARKEVEEARNSETGESQPKALRRLNAILGHLQNR